MPTRPARYVIITPREQPPEALVYVSRAVAERDACLGDVVVQVPTQFDPYVFAHSRDRARYVELTPTSSRRSRSSALDRLLRHMEVHYSDRAVKDDLDCVTDCCSTEAERVAVKAYARARKNAPGWAPHIAGSSNANRVATDPSTATMKTCESCGQLFAAKRSDARFCSPRCRNLANRASRETVVDV